MSERWLPVVGFDGFYEVSDSGLVRAIPRLRCLGGIRKPFANKKGHLRIDLYRPGNHKRQYVHRTVLEAFVGPCPIGMEGCHGDGDPSNNRLDNLRWGTPGSNWADARKHGTARVRDTHHWTKLSSMDVAEILALRRAHGLLQREIAGRFGVCQQTISHILRRAA